MDTELTPKQKFNAEDPECMVPRALLEGRSRDAIIADLIRLDWSPAAAETLVERVARDLVRYQASPESRAALVRECRRQMISGFVIAFLGALATALSAIAAVAGMAVWFIFGGLILVGLVYGTRGYSRWRLYRRDSFPPTADD